MINPSEILITIPTALRDCLLETYKNIGKNYLEQRWEAAELNGGKFCECVYAIVHGYLTGTYSAKPSKPKDMFASCRALENIQPDASRVGDRSMRILIPRAIPYLYEIRNNRGVGHVGGDVDSNFLDATSVYNMSNWIMAEFVRIFHNTTTKEAQTFVDCLAEWKPLLVWQLEDIKRVLSPKMSKTDQTLILLLTTSTWVLDKDIFDWVEYSNLKKFQRNILLPLHKKRFIEYDANQKRLSISPIGVQYAKKKLIEVTSISPQHPL
ncbi:hypothetical protein IT412_00665 [Candidatus Peregrinibacteria bacterium]|nr:hypothetical protein [Candidatus Peregrinibacteria bacterium]